MVLYRNRARSARGVAMRAARDGGLLAVLGILSHEDRLEFRSASRTSWLRSLPADLRAWFVVRGLDVRQAMLEEASSHRDVIFVNASSKLGRSSGPLVSLFLWYAHAVRHFPDVTLIGKMDDDTWLHGGGLATLLGSSLRWLGKASHAYIGRFEQSHWSTASHNEGPLQLGVQLPRKTCVRQALKAGPFAFAKGPIYLVSTALARLVAEANETRREVDYLVSSEAVRCFRGSALYRQNQTDASNGERVGWRRTAKLRKHAGLALHLGGAPCQGAAPTLMPYEDVWTGWALSSLHTGPVTIINLPKELFRDDYGLRVKQTHVSVHGRIDRDFARRTRVLTKWAETHHCDAAHAFKCTSRDAAHAFNCVGQPWRRCRVWINESNSGCDLQEVNLFRRCRNSKSHRSLCTQDD